MQKFTILCKANMVYYAWACIHFTKEIYATITFIKYFGHKSNIHEIYLNTNTLSSKLTSSKSSWQNKIQNI